MFSLYNFARFVMRGDVFLRLAVKEHQCRDQ